MLHLVVLLEKARRPKQAELEASGQLRLEPVRVEGYLREGWPVQPHVRHQRIHQETPHDHITSTGDHVAKMRAAGRHTQLRTLLSVLKAHGLDASLALHVDRAAKQLTFAPSYRKAVIQVVDRHIDRMQHDRTFAEVGSTYESAAHQPHRGPTGYHQIRAAIDAWEDEHHADLEESTRIVIGAGPHVGIYFDMNPATTRQLSPHADTKHVCAISDNAVHYAQVAGTAILTHNHPNGASLSGEDIQLGCDLNLAEIRAASRDGTWVLRRPADGWPARGAVAIATWDARNDVSENFGGKRGDTDEALRSRASKLWDELAPKHFAKIGRTHV